MEKHVIGIRIEDRMNVSIKVQEVLTKYGCNIKTRIGLHEATDTTCSPSGILLLEVVGEEAKRIGLADELKQIEGLNVQEMIL